jgi:guanylate kinase
MKPLLLILSAPSGTGKTTLARRLCKAHPGALFSVSFTTRKPRGKEQDGVDYHFVDEARFQQLIDENAFVEHAYVHGQHYGTPRSSIEQTQTLAIFDIDVQGGQSIKREYADAVRVLVVPPALGELERRLRARSTDDDATIQRRLRVAREELRLALAAGYEYWVVNDDLERAYADLEAIVRAEGCRAGKRALAPDLGVP